MAEAEDTQATVTGESGAENDDEERFVELDPLKRYGRYSEVLGKGAFKTVYRAFDEVEGIEVAWNQVKVQDILKSPEDLERLYSEVHLLKTLKHKNIIKFFSSWVDTKTKNVNFITEIFTSGTLRQYRQKHKHCDLKAVKNWSRQILRGLLYLHSHDPPIIHRDLKCDNIFVNGNQGEVKIGDLGLAAILQKSQAHSVIGTPEFMAPELYEEEYNELVDIYSFGMCLLEMLTFEYPYSECSNAAQIYKKVTAGRKPAALDKVKDPEVRAFVEKCLASASSRLPARELLMDPFLKEESDSNLPRNDTRGENLDSFSSQNGSIPRPPSLQNDIGSEGSQEAAGDLVIGGDKQAKSQEISDAAESKAGSLEEDPDNSPDEEEKDDEVSETKPSLKVGSSYDFKIKGQLDEDNDQIFLRLRIVDGKDQARNIHFPFDVKTDTAFSVASEMVEELNLTDQDVCTIAEMIDKEIMKLVPDWRPGVAVDATDAESNGAGDADRYEDDERIGDDGDDKDKSLDIKISASPDGPFLLTDLRARSVSPLRSQNSMKMRGVLMSPSRASLGAASPPKGLLDGGVVHGRFWEGSGNLKENSSGPLLPIVFSSEDDNSNNESTKISTVPEDEALGDDEADNPPRNFVRKNHSRSGSHSLSVTEGEEEEEEKENEIDKDELDLSDVSGDVSEASERLRSNRRFSSFADMNELRKKHSLQSQAVRMEDEILFRGRGGQRQRSLKGESSFEDERMSEEESFLVNKVRELEELEMKYRGLLEDLRNRQNKARGNDFPSLLSDRRRLDSSRTLSTGSMQVLSRESDRGREDTVKRNNTRNGSQLSAAAAEYRSRQKERDRIRNRDRVIKSKSPSPPKVTYNDDDHIWTGSAEEDQRRPASLREKLRKDRILDLVTTRTLSRGQSKDSSPSKNEVAMKEQQRKERELERELKRGDRPPSGISNNNNSSKEVARSRGKDSWQKSPAAVSKGSRNGALDYESRSSRDWNYSDSVRVDAAYRNDYSDISVHRNNTDSGSRRLKADSPSLNPSRKDSKPQYRWEEAEDKDMAYDSRRSRDREKNSSSSSRGGREQQYERSVDTGNERKLYYALEDSRGRREYDDKPKRGEYYRGSDEEIKGSSRRLARNSNRQAAYDEYVREQRSGFSSSSGRANKSRERLRAAKGDSADFPVRPRTGVRPKDFPSEGSLDYPSDSERKTEEASAAEKSASLVRTKSGSFRTLFRSSSNRSRDTDDSLAKALRGNSSEQTLSVAVRDEDEGLSTEEGSPRGAKTDTELFLGVGADSVAGAELTTEFGAFEDRKLNSASSSFHFETEKDAKRASDLG